MPHLTLRCNVRITARTIRGKPAFIRALMDDAFARCPEREAIVYEDWRLTYGDLERYIHQTAHYLRHLGVRKGSRVAILSRNCPEWIIAEFALYQLGAIVVKINWRLTPPEQARMLARNQVSVAFLKAEKPEWGAELERLCADSVRLIRLELAFLLVV